MNNIYYCQKTQKLVLSKLVEKLSKINVEKKWIEFDYEEMGKAEQYEELEIDEENLVKKAKLLKKGNDVKMKSMDKMSVDQKRTIESLNEKCPIASQY